MRLSAVHSAAELAALVAGEMEPQPKPPDDNKPMPPSPRPAATAAARLPESIRGLYDPRPGYVNFHFNTVERERVARGLTTSRAAAATGPWELAGTLAAGGRFRIQLADEEAVIDLPTGTTRIDPRGDLAGDAGPPGSGGLLAALAVWRRMVHGGPAALTGTTYLGTAPREPRDLVDAAAVELVDLLEVAVAGVTAQVAVGADGCVSHVDLWMDPEGEPCEVRFGPPAPDDPRGLPGRIDVARGGEPFGTFLVEPAEETP